MFSLIDVRVIIKEHYRTLLEDAKFRFIFLNFFIIPLVISILLVYSGKLLTLNSTNALITAFTLFAGFLLSIIFILFDIVGKINEQKEDNTRSPEEIKRARDVKKLLNHLYSNSLYALFISVINLIASILIAITEIWQETPAPLNSISPLNITATANVIPSQDLLILQIISLMVYFLVMHFIMTLLMILRRLSILLYSQSEK